MKMLRNLLKLSVVATVAFCLIACGANGDKSEKIDAKDLESLELVAQKVQGKEVNMIPDNALLAFQITPKDLWDKVVNNLDLNAKSQLNGLLWTLSQNAEFIKNPESLGLDLDAPLMLSANIDVTSYEPAEVAFEAWLVASLENRDNFIQQLDTVFEMIEEEISVTKKSYGDSYTHYMIYSDEEGAFDLGVLANAAVLRVTYDSSSDFENMPQSMAKLFVNGGPAKSEGLDNFYGSLADAALWVDIERCMDFLMPILKEEEQEVYEQLEQFIPLYKGSSWVTELNFNKGCTTLEFDVYGNDQLKENALKYNTPASDKYLSYLPASSVFVLNVAIKNFAGLVDELSAANEEMAEMLESLEPLGFDEELFEGFPGVITLAVDGYEINELDTPHIILVMECDNNVWEFLESYLDESAESVSNGLYRVEDYYIGYNDGMAFVMDVETMERAMAGSELGFAQTELARKIRKGGLVFNLAALPDELLDSAAEEVLYSMTGRDLLEYVSSVTLTTSEDFMSATITVNMGDESNNLISKIINEVLR